MTNADRTGRGDTTPRPTPTENRRGSRMSSGDRRTVLAYVLAVVLAALAGAWSQRLWSADLTIPFSYSGDAVAVSAHFKTVLETGWYEFQPLLGAPRGQTYHDFPAADNLHMLVALLLGPLLGGSWAVTLNVYFLLGFPLCALTAMVFLRAAGVSRTFSVPMAVLFAIAPYHLLRGESHLFLASYYPVPLALLLVLRVVRGEPLWTLRRTSVRAFVTSPAVATVLIAALVASGSAYYAVFTLALLAVSGIAAFFHRRRWQALVGAAGYGAVLVAVMLLNMLPDVLWARTHGSVDAALVRSPADAEYYALKLTSLLLPTPGHALGTLARIRAEYDGGYPLPSEQPALGAVGALGLVLLLVVAVLAVLRPRASRFVESTLWGRLTELAGLVLVAVLFGTVGGVSSLISFVTPEIRGWNRISIFLALLCLTGVGLVLDGLRRVAAGRFGVRPAALVAAGASVLLVIVGVWDQASPALRPNHEATRVAFESDATFVADIESALGPDAMIAQLPFAPFPESPPVNGVLDTDQLRMYLHSETLRWSAGGIKGRASSDWLGALDQADAAATATSLAAAGFSGVTLDRLALGDTADAMSAAWTAELGPPFAVSPDGRYEAYTLVPLREQLDEANGEDVVDAAGEGVVEPTFVSSGRADSAVVGDDGSWTMSAADGTVEIVLDNGREDDARVTLTMVLPAPGATVTWPDGSISSEPGGLLSRALDLSPGRSSVVVSSLTAGVPVTVSQVAAGVADRPVLEPEGAGR